MSEGSLTPRDETSDEQSAGERLMEYLADKNVDLVQEINLLRRTLARATEELNWVAGQIGFATDEAIAKRIDAFLNQKPDGDTRGEANP